MRACGYGMIRERVGIRYVCKFLIVSLVFTWFEEQKFAIEFRKHIVSLFMNNVGVAKVGRPWTNQSLHPL